MRGYRYFYIILFLILLSTGASFAKNEGKGYIGTLPDLTKNYVPKEEEKPPIQAIPSQDFNSENALKPVPKDDPTFVNIILKPNKTSKYILELNEFIPMLETISDMIEQESNVQVFNAKVYYFNRNVDYFRDKYDGKPESHYLTYKKLMELNTHAQSVALLRSEAQKYNPYLAYESEGYVYNPNNIRQQLEYLKKEIDQIILILREAK